MEARGWRQETKVTQPLTTNLACRIAQTMLKLFDANIDNKLGVLHCSKWFDHVTCFETTRMAPH